MSLTNKITPPSKATQKLTDWAAARFTSGLKAVDRNIVAATLKPGISKAELKLVIAAIESPDQVQVDNALLEKAANACDREAGRACRRFGITDFKIPNRPNGVTVYGGIFRDAAEELLCAASSTKIEKGLPKALSGVRRLLELSEDPKQYTDRVRRTEI